MCGLSGFLSPHPLPDARETLDRMNRTLHHRGPDEDGLFTAREGKVGLGHKRLSILDLSAGKQPMTCPEGLYTVVFNGEIYNHADLKRDLLQKGHPLKSRSDTEALLYAFKEWGPGCLPRLRGMFAFAVYDHRKGSIFLARDRLGIKPLYYGRHRETVLFGSECKALLAFPGFEAELDREALSDYLSLLYVPAPKSIFRHIRKLPPGHYAEVDAAGKVRVERYWDLAFAPPAPNGGPQETSPAAYARAEEELSALLAEAVESHLESDVPLGAFLSGGVDSSAVVAFMARRGGGEVRTHTVGFRPGPPDEIEAARKTARHFGTRHEESLITPDAVSLLEKLSYHYDEPFADSSLLPTYEVCAAARRSVTVALSGDGGDESFAGYRRYYFDRFENRLRALLPASLRRGLFGPLAALYPKADFLPRPLRARTMLKSLSLSPLEGYFRTMSHLSPEAKEKLLSGDFRRSLGGYSSLSAFEPHWKACDSRDPLSRIQYLDFKTYLEGDILTKVDRASMAVSLEVRVPLLDHKVVEFAAALPPSFKLRGRRGKRILKSALRRTLPPEIFERPKTGFSIPLASWLRGGMRDFAKAEILGRGGLSESGWFEEKALKALWDGHQSGLSDQAYPLFTLLALSLWRKRFLGGGAAGRTASPPGPAGIRPLSANPSPAPAPPA